MAGRGFVPKDPSARRRRNAPIRGEWTVLDRPRLKKAPPLPRPYPKGGYSARSKAEWASWWKSSVAPMWDGADHGSVAMLLRMVDDWWDTPTAAMGSEIRQYKDNLGLTPKGRQDRRWLLPAEAPPEFHLIPGGRAQKHHSNVRRIRAVETVPDSDG